MNSVSVTGKKWVLKDFNISHSNFLIDNYFLDSTVAKLIAIKNIKREEIENYLNPAIKNSLPNPSVLKGMDKATLRTLEAIIKKEKVGIFGDYDVDGASSTALLGRYFKHVNLKFEIYIPDRKLEGFGPTIKGFENMIKKNPKLIFTVDCGTLSFEPINFANEKKIDVLVLDYHQSEIKLPNAYSIINPNQIDDSSNLNNLCAAGVCFMFLISLNRELKKINWFKNNKIKELNLIEYLDLVSLGTVCDVVSLKGYNRMFVKIGLELIKQRKNRGISKIIDNSNLKYTPSSSDLGFIVGPQLNAASRIDDSTLPSKILISDNIVEIESISRRLILMNEKFI